MAVGFVLCFFVHTIEDEFYARPDLRDSFFGYFKQRVGAVLTMFRSVPFVLGVIPAILALSAQVALTFQVVPQLIKFASASTSLSILHVVSYLLYGVGAMLAAIVTGALFDYSWRAAWIFFLVVEVSGDVILLAMGLWPMQMPAYVFVCVGFLRGCADYALTTIIQCIGIEWFPKESTPFFAAFRVSYCLVYVPIAIVSGPSAGLLPFYGSIALCLGLCLVSTIASCIVFSKKGE